MPNRVFLVCAAALLASCGYVGDPLPPALNIPEQVTDLAVIQRGDRLLIGFRAPALTTEALTIDEFKESDLRIGLIPTPFSMEDWAAKATPVPVSPKPGERVQVDVPVDGWAGHEVLVAVRFFHPRGRPSEWSNPVTLAVRHPLAPPRGVQAESHPQGVRVSWEEAEPGLSYRVSRRFEGQEEAAVVGTVTGNEFIDAGATLGRPHIYTVQAVSGASESNPSAAATVAPRDIFAPEPPAGLTAVAGLGSIELTWERSTAADLRGYRLYRAAGAGEFSLLADAIDGPAYSDRQISPGTTYRFRVTAIDEAGNESEPSATIEVSAP